MTYSLGDGENQLVKCLFLKITGKEFGVSWALPTSRQNSPAKKKKKKKRRKKKKKKKRKENSFATHSVSWVNLRVDSTSFVSLELLFDFDVDNEKKKSFLNFTSEFHEPN